MGDGAGEGNRTLVFSLEGCCSTIELHPRARHQLSRRDISLNRHAGGRLGKRNRIKGPGICRPGPLTAADSLPILIFPSTQRKEVIQCLIPSAVTSLGSPAKPFQAWQRRALSPGPASYESRDATGAIPSRLFFKSRCGRLPADADGNFPGPK